MRFSRNFPKVKRHISLLIIQNASLMWGFFIYINLNFFLSCCYCPFILCPPCLIGLSVWVFYLQVDSDVCILSSVPLRVISSAPHQTNRVVKKLSYLKMIRWGGLKQGAQQQQPAAEPRGPLRQQVSSVQLHTKR